MRLLQIIIVLFGISFITFGLTYMSPGDPVRNMYSANGVMPTEEMVEQTREEMGLMTRLLCSMADGLETACMVILEPLIR